MTSFFSLVVECSKNFNEKNIVLDFYTLLAENGLTYVGGCNKESDNYSLSEIATKNHCYLLNEKNSQNVEKYVWDFLQVDFQYLNFYKTHVLIFDDPNDDFFTFEMIIPEDDLVVGNFEKVYWDREKANQLLCLAKQIWKKTYVNSIQTELEISEGFSSVNEIAQGKEPSVEPFAILPEKVISNRINEFSVYEQAERGGVILLNWDSTDFVWNLLPKDWKKRLLHE